MDEFKPSFISDSKNNSSQYVEAVFEGIEEGEGVCNFDDGYEDFCREIGIDIDEEDTERTRKASDVALTQVENLNDLNAENEAESYEKVKDVLRKVWGENIRVHNLKSSQNGIEKGLNNTDFDGKACLALLDKAGIKVDTKRSETYIDKGTLESGKTNIDTGNKDRVVASPFKFSADRREYDIDDTVIIDHHSADSDPNSSSAEILYSVLSDLDLLEKNPSLDRFVKFVSDVDNLNFDKYGDYFKHSDSNLLGLYKFIPQENIEKVIDLLDKIKSPAQDLKEGKSEEEYNQLLFDLGIIRPKNPRRDEEPYKFDNGEVFIHDKSVPYKSVPFYNYSEDRKKSVEDSNRAIKELERPESGFTFDSEQFGRVLVDVGEEKLVKGKLHINNKVKLSSEAAYANGYDTYIRWSRQTNSYFISSKEGLSSDFFLDSGIMIRGRMYLSKNDQSNLLLNLSDVIEKIGDKDFQPEGKLEKFIIEEQFGNRKIEIDNKDERADRFLNEINPELKRYFIKEAEKCIESGRITTSCTMENFDEDIDRMAALSKLVEDDGHSVGEFYFHQINRTAEAEIKKSEPIEVSDELIKEEIERASEYMSEGSEWQALSDKESDEVSGKKSIHVWRNSRNISKKNSGAGEYKVNPKAKYIMKGSIGSTAYSSRIILSVSEDGENYDIDIPLRSLFNVLRPKDAKIWNKEVMNGVLDYGRSLAREKEEEQKSQDRIKDTKSEIIKEEQKNPKAGEAIELGIANINEVGKKFWDDVEKEYGKEIILKEKIRILESLKVLASSGEFVYSLGKNISNELLIEKSEPLAGIYVLAKENHLLLDPYFYYPETGFAVAKLKKEVKKDKERQKRIDEDEAFQDGVMKGEEDNHLFSKLDKFAAEQSKIERGESGFKDGVLYLATDYEMIMLKPGVSRTWIGQGENGENVTLTVKNIREIDHNSSEKHYEIAFLEKKYARARSLEDWITAFEGSCATKNLN